MKILKKLIWINIIGSIIYILFHSEYLIKMLSLKSDITSTLSTPWSLITYSFLHVSIFHLIGNMIALYFLGLIFCSIFGMKKLLSFYLITSIFGGLCTIFIYSFIDKPMIYGVGSSVVIYGLLVSTAMVKPNLKLDFFITSIKLKWIAIGYILIEFLINTNIGHLSGALFGLLYSLYYIHHFQMIKKSPIESIHKISKDDILDKINKRGIKSLSKNELKILKE